MGNTYNTIGMTKIDLKREISICGSPIKIPPNSSERIGLSHGYIFTSIFISLGINDLNKLIKFCRSLLFLTKATTSEN